MHINTDTLFAFIEIYKKGSFTNAAKEIGLSQSALSQKISRLEDQLQATLFIRKSEGLELTDAGSKLLIFSKQQLEFEQNFIDNFNQYTTDPKGVFRLAAFSSILRSVLIPCLSPYLRDQQGIKVEFSSHEMKNLERILRTNQSDAIVLDYFPGLPGIKEEQIGEEEYVLIESKKYAQSPSIYLDHHHEDNATDSFFKFQGEKLNYQRGFMGDVYGILDGVEQGLGKAVISKHLIKKDPRFRVKKSRKIYQRPVVLCYFEQSYYSPIHQFITEALKEESSHYL